MTRFERYRVPEQFDLPATMKALVLRGRGFENLAVEEVPVPQPGPRQLLARVDAAGVCTSILKLLAQGPDHTFLNGWDLTRFPVILGDEGSVTLMSVGAELAHRYSPGERFAVQPAVDHPPINHRDRYRNEARGMNKVAVGYSLPGHLAQYMLIPEEVLEAGCLLPLPSPELPFFAVSMSEPISCVVSAQDRQIHLTKESPFAPRVPRLGMLEGGITAVIGAGAMGRMHAELAMRFRPRAVIVADLLDERLTITHNRLGDKARRLGIELVTVKPDELEAAVERLSNGGGVDDLVLAVGVQPVQQQALKLLGVGGVANLFGGLPRGKHILEVDAIRVHYDEIKLVGSSGGQPSDMIATLKAIHEEQIDPGNYVHGVGGLAHAPEILRAIEAAKVDGKAILYPHADLPDFKTVDHWDGQRERELLERTLGDHAR
ncbi:MAG: zinc-binding dehydrogenase [Phycisphaeraceae bacterium]|nr:zinc-binding dehydrogenase [Phycisphaeraceae bacterium]